jgi:SpoVK/Ycf46/Vps4 family AAA+-type ATPase
MESFQGLAILTTNSKTSLDKAFERRLRFTIDFPFPGAGERQAIWRHILPTQVPTEGLDPAQLANLNMSGGSIRNIALNAAFMAAEADSPVRMGHILAAVQLEAAKIERPISETEIRGWAQNQAPDAKASPLRSQSGGRP